MSQEQSARESVGRPPVADLGEIGHKMMHAADLRSDNTLFCTGELVLLISLLDAEGRGVPEEIVHTASVLAINWLLAEGGLS